MSTIAYKSDMSIDERVMMAIVRLAERFKKNSSAIVKKWGLTFSQYNVLRVLDASENGQNTMKNVNRIMLVSGANMTGIAKRLEKNGSLSGQTIRTTIVRKDCKLLRRRTGSQHIADLEERSVRKYLMNYSDEQKTALLETLREILRKTKNKR